MAAGGACTGHGGTRDSGRCVFHGWTPPQAPRPSCGPNSARAAVLGKRSLRQEDCAARVLTADMHVFATIPLPLGEAGRRGRRAQQALSSPRAGFTSQTSSRHSGCWFDSSRRSQHHHFACSGFLTSDLGWQKAGRAHAQEGSALQCSRSLDAHGLPGACPLEYLKPRVCLGKASVIIVS